MPIHEAAAIGLGSAAGAYERARPGYPFDAIACLTAAGRIDATAVVLDLACGTGKLTRELEPTGATIVAADPVATMIARCRVAAPRALLAHSTAEQLAFAPASFEAVVVAQAFHWFDGPVALAEIHRVLRPGGLLALIWNIRDTTVEWVARLNDVFNRYEGDVMRFWRQEWRKPFETSDSFTPLHLEEFRYRQVLTREGVIDRVLSVSFIAMLPPDERARVVRDVEAILDDDPQTRGSDAIVLPYLTHLFTCRRIP